MEAKKVGKTLADVQAKALVDSLLETLLQVVAKRIADTPTGMEVEPPVKTVEVQAKVPTHWQAMRGRAQDTRKHTCRCYDQGIN